VQTTLVARGEMAWQGKSLAEICQQIKDPADPARRHLVDVIIDHNDVDGLGPNWTAQPVWSHEVSNNDKQEFIGAMFEVLRDYDLLTDD
jgi:hypothetical protein